MSKRNGPDFGDISEDQSPEAIARAVEIERDSDVRRRAGLGYAAVLTDPDFKFNDPRTNAIDVIANILHWLGSTGETEDPQSVCDMAICHYIAEREGE